MILLGLGANLDHPDFGSPRATLEAALAALEAAGLTVRSRSPWYRSAPVPPSDQPWFVNGVVALDTALEPKQLLALLHRVEAEFGRIRQDRNEARVLDLDLLAWGRRVSAAGESPVLPHPHLAERAFVVLPLRDLAPRWRHPVSDLSVAELIRRLPSDQTAERLPDPSPGERAP